jgi:hypothetical protein
MDALTEKIVNDTLDGQIINSLGVFRAEIKESQAYVGYGKHT